MVKLIGINHFHERTPSIHKNIRQFKKTIDQNVPKTNIIYPESHSIFKEERIPMDLLLEKLRYDFYEEYVEEIPKIKLPKFFIGYDFDVNENEKILEHFEAEYDTELFSSEIPLVLAYFSNAKCKVWQKVDDKLVKNSGTLENHFILGYDLTNERYNFSEFKNILSCDKLYSKILREFFIPYSKKLSIFYILKSEGLNSNYVNRDFDFSELEKQN